MCPGCFASAALVAGTVISTGGVTALVAKIVSARGRSKNGHGPTPETPHEFPLRQTKTDRRKGE